MDFLEVALTSVSMSIDAMTVNASNGIREKNMSIRKMILISLTFGVFQFLMPLIGYLIGSTFKDAIENILPWIAFSLLTLLSIKSLVEWIKERKSKEEELEVKKISPLDVFMQGIATSIDALCIGFVYLSLDIGHALIAFGIIGVTAFILPFLTVLFARYLSKYLEKWAGLIASIVFLIIGIKILLESIL
ncbi:MAG: manganese efflux pump [Erysipelotrichales bacterium]|nr:manganese efflux pump [Erysipelotrichales bacterium]